MNRFSGFLAGLLFGIGLAASGMTDTAKVIGFLRVFSNWDPDLMYVMGAAVVTTLIGFRIVLKRSSPVFDRRFYLPSKSELDLKLVFGAVLFGVGWGLYGYCPGPAIASLIYIEPATLIFTATMLSGMFFMDRLSKIVGRLT